MATVSIKRMSRVEGEVAAASDHFPIRFEATWDIDRETNARRIPKTLLQSTHLRSALGLVYKAVAQGRGVQDRLSG